MQIDMTRMDPDCGMDRFYSVQLTRSIFGDSGVHRQWGRHGTWGRHRLDWFETDGEAKCALFELVKEKQARGYLLKAPIPRRWAL